MDKISTKQKIALFVFGLFLFLILLELGLRLGGFILLSIQEYRNRLSLKQKGTYRIICLGESTTACTDYPEQLQEILNQSNLGIRFSVFNKGIPGTNTGAILSQLEDNLNEYKPNMVITMMGINDYGMDYFQHKGADYKDPVNLLRKLRVYKLAKLLKQHIVYKAKEMTIYFGRKEKDYTVEKRLKQESEDSNLYIDLDYFYSTRGKFDQAEKIFKKIIQRSPFDYQAYVELGNCYLWQSKNSQAEEILKKAIEINPNYSRAYARLGNCYLNQDKYLQAEEMFEKAIELDSEEYCVYLELAECYREQGKYPQAEETLKKVIKINPHRHTAYIQLSICYIDQAKHSQATDMIKETIEEQPRFELLLYRALALIYLLQGKVKLSEDYFKKADELQLKYLLPATKYNYRRLREIIKQKGIQLICVQYPMRNIESLKQIFDDKTGIIFVDNEIIFKQVVRKEGHAEYFRDVFAGDFGHCTPKGNRLLAENIANTILKEYFKID